MIRPLQNYILISPIEEEMSPGGIHLPVQPDADFQRARVVAVGPGTEEAPTIGIKKGAIVLCRTAAGSKITVEGKKMALVDSRAIVAVEEPK
jgi:co-chaperonin GroES (HSP10)